MSRAPIDRGIEAQKDGFVVRTRHMAEVASTQARVIARQKERSRRRGQQVKILGCFAGCLGLAGSVLVALMMKAVDEFWWLLVPSWILSSFPILLLLQSGDDSLVALWARLAGTADLAEGRRRMAEAAPAAFQPGPEGIEPLGPLTALVERDIEAASRSLRTPPPGGEQARRHRRLVPRRPKVIVTTADGRRLRATIADISLSGVAMTESLPRLSKGESVLVGRKWARVVRIWERGIAFEFETELDPSTFDEEIVL